MRKTREKLFAILLSIAVIAGFVPIVGTQTAYAADEPAAIQDTYELNGVTYYNVGSGNFAANELKFYRDMLGTRTSRLAQGGYDQSESDLWLQVGTMLLSDNLPDGLKNRTWRIGYLYNAAERGSYYKTLGSSEVDQATRYDLEGKSSPKAAEEWVFQKTFGENKKFGYFKDDNSEQLTLATAVNLTEIDDGRTENVFTVAAYFTNFRVFAIMPADEGTNYVTELISDSVNSKSTIASTVKNLTASTVTGSQSVANSTTATVSSSVSGSETYSYSEGIKVGAEYGFSKAFKGSLELSFSASQAFASGWGSSESLSTSKNASYTVSIPMSPYTQAMLTQTDTTSVYLTSYNCPIAIKYDVTIVAYQAGDDGDGIMHINKHVDEVDLDKDTVYSFANPRTGARGDLYDRINGYEDWGDMDEEGLRWRFIMEGSPYQYDLDTAPDAIRAAASHVPMSSTGASYTQTLNVVASEVSGLMPTHPLYRVKIAEPSINIHSDEVSYQLFDYFTAKMKVGDYSYANYMSLVGLNRYDVPFYGFSKDNGYWIITDKQGNELDPADSPVLLEKDPVSKNWRYTAVKPGTCYMVYRIDEDAYYIADKPEEPIKNEDLAKTAALEIIVAEDENAADHEHQMARTKRKAATCTELGNIEYYTCSVCEGIFKDKAGTEELCEGDIILPALGHDWTEWETEADPTEQEEGLQSRFCKNDTSHQQTRTVPVLSHKHTMVKTGKKAPNCTDEGNIMYYTCNGCGCVFTDAAGNNEIDPSDTVMQATGHKWDSGKVTREPTAEEEGIKTYTCTACGETKTEAIAKLEKQAEATAAAEKQANPLKITPKTAAIKYSKLKKKAQTLAVTKVMTFANDVKDKKTYTLSSVKKGSKSFKKYFKINKTTGKVTVKKGLKKGTYKVTVKVNAVGNSIYKASGMKTVTFKVTVK